MDYVNEKVKLSFINKICTRYIQKWYALGHTTNMNDLLGVIKLMGSIVWACIDDYLFDYSGR